MSVSAQSSTELRVTFVAPTENPEGTTFSASSSGYSCDVSAEASPLSCLLTGLSSGTKYTVEALACLGSVKCSSPISTMGYTTPDGRFD